MSHAADPDKDHLQLMDTQDADDARSEATFQFHVKEFSKLKGTLLSPPCWVRSLPWKIMVMPRLGSAQDGSPQRCLGFFLQCNGQSQSTSWSCKAVADLRLLSVKEGQEPFTKKIHHLFFSKEDDWGFSTFMAWDKVLDPEKGYIKDDAITLEVWLAADPPEGVSLDSKQHKGYMELKNQAAKCNMNSLLETENRKLKTENEEMKVECKVLREENEKMKKRLQELHPDDSGAARGDPSHTRNLT